MTDLQAEPGTTPPMTIVEPNLVVTKKSSVSNLSAGSKAPYTIDVQNIGGSDAWNTTITDNIPAGMCTYDLRPTITAEIYAADGVTPDLGTARSRHRLFGHLERRHFILLPDEPCHADAKG